jgi:hypothetical protein
VTPATWSHERFTTLLAFYNRDDGLSPAVAARLLVLDVSAVEAETRWLAGEGFLTTIRHDGALRMTPAGVAALRSSGRLTTATLDYQGREMRASLDQDYSICRVCSEPVTRKSAHMGLYWSHDEPGLHDHDASPRGGNDA